MVDKAYTVIQGTELFVTACLDWNAMASDRWTDLKDHFTKAYKAFLIIDLGPTTHHGYARNMVVPGFSM